MSIILGIDPGASTGCALYRAGELVHMQTIEPHEIDTCITEVQPARVVFEDSRLQSKVWTPVKGAAALKVARNIGEIDAWCRLIAAVCARQAIAAHGVSPKGKGAKLTQEQFAVVTGWGKRCNQHERDAAIAAWPYRRAAHV